MIALLTDDEKVLNVQSLFLAVTWMFVFSREKEVKQRSHHLAGKTYIFTLYQEYKYILKKELKHKLKKADLFLL